MKLIQKNKVKRHSSKNKPVKKPSKEQIQIVAHEIKFARLLSGNEKKVRDRALKTLKKWLTNCFQKGYKFKEDDFIRIWKGLFYAVWMSDKPLIQEELCENIASILDQFPSEQYEYALMMVKVGFQAMATEWYGIDHHRMDKCLMLVRRYLRGSLRCIARSGWSDRACKLYADMLTANDGIMALKTPLYARNAVSMILHFIDCYLEELSKVSGGSIPESGLVQLLRPFCEYLGAGAQGAVVAASRRLLTALVRQSDAGLVYQDKARAWAQMGCPEGGPEALEEISDDDEEGGGGSDGAGDSSDDDEQEAEDPRAGRVHVTLRPLPVPAAALARLLAGLRTSAASRAHRRLTIAMKRFEALAVGEYPLKVEEVPLETVAKSRGARAAARSLAALDRQLLAASDELQLRGLSRKHRKRLLARRGAAPPPAHLDTRAPPAHAAASAAGDWLVEETKPDTAESGDQSGHNATDKENVKRKKKRADRADATHKKRKPERQEQTTPVIREKAKSIEKATKAKVVVSPAASDTLARALLNTSQTKVETVQTETRQAKKQLTKNSKNPITVLKAKKYNNEHEAGVDSENTHTPKRVKFVLAKNGAQGCMDYLKSVRRSPRVPFDAARAPVKTNLKPSTPSPINPFFKNKWKIK